ncbi:MAG: hypothetical protein WC124_01970 [Desulfoplanes sp.]
MEITTDVPVEFQFYQPLQIRYSQAGPLSGKLLVMASNLGGYRRFSIWNSDLTFFDKFYVSNNSTYAIDSDATNIYTGNSAGVRQHSFQYDTLQSIALLNIGMIDAANDPLHCYVTTKNSTEGHGIRMITKSTMAVTDNGSPVQILATGTGDNQFTSPQGVLYIATNADSGFLYVCEATRICKIAVVTTAGSESFTWNTSYEIAATDLAWDGTNFYVQSSTQTIKYDNVFTDATKVAISRVGSSITYIPDQSDGNGATLGISDYANSCIRRIRCSNLGQIAWVGIEGDGTASLVDPKITGANGFWRDDTGKSLAVASAANIIWNGIPGNFFKSTGQHRMTWVGRLGSITAIEFDSDGLLSIRNIQKCINVTSLKIQNNPGLVLNLGILTSKLVTLWIQGCGAGIQGVISHMTKLTSLDLSSNDADQETVDGWVNNLWQNRTIMAPCTVNIHGSNANPSGVYQTSEAPSTGYEKIYDLVTNYGWTFDTE